MTKFMLLLCTLLVSFASDNVQISTQEPSDFDQIQLLHRVNVLVSPIHEFSSLNHKERRLFCKNNLNQPGIDINCTCLVISLLQCGDIQPEPGPPKKTVRKPKHPCVHCGVGVTARSKAISCDVCDRWVHARCTGFLTKSDYDNLVANEQGLTYLCNDCSFNDLPFNIPDDYSEDTPSNFKGQRPTESDTDHFDCLHRKGLHCIHLNARSLLPKLSELRCLAIKTKVAVIGITETWLDDTVTDNEVAIPGYNIVRHDRDRHGGGTCVYIRNDIAFNPRKDLESDCLEAVWTEILLPKTKPIMIGICYRPPKQNSFSAQFEETLSKIRSDCELMVLGDMNICMLHPASSLSRNYLSVCNLFGLRQLISEPTRVTDISSTILDHILCNNSEKICQSGVITVGISDHYMTYVSRKVVKGQINGHKTVKIRSLRNYTRDKLVESLNSVNWSDVSNCSDVNQAWSTFESLFTGVLDIVAPVKEVRLKQRAEPWFTCDILDLIKERDSVLLHYKKSKNSDVYKEYCKLRNKVQRTVKRAKSEYLASQIEENKNNPKMLWQHLKGLGYSSKSKENCNMVLNIDGELCYDSKTIANHINKFYTTIASTLVGKLPPAPNLFHVASEKFKQYYIDKGVRPNSVKLQPVSTDFITKELNKLNIHKSTGLDGIPARFLKDGCEVLNRPITHTHKT